MEEEVLKGKTLLVVDDEVDLRDIMASELEFMGAQVFQAENITSAKEILKSNPIDLVVSDIRMPGGTGIDLLDYVKAKDPFQPPMVLITGFADISLEDAYAKGAEAMLNKPFKLDDLIKVVERNTRSLEERFKDTEAQPSQDLILDLPLTLAEAKASKQLAQGRGGLSVVMNTQRKKIEIGETLNVDIKLLDRRYQGLAVCRWVKAVEQAKVGMGLEFVNFAGGTQRLFQESWKNPTISYIPAL